MESQVLVTVPEGRSERVHGLRGRRKMWRSPSNHRAKFLCLSKTIHFVEYVCCRLVAGIGNADTVTCTVIDGTYRVAQRVDFRNHPPRASCSQRQIRFAPSVSLTLLPAGSYHTIPSGLPGPPRRSPGHASHKRLSTCAFGIGFCHTSAGCVVFERSDIVQSIRLAYHTLHDVVSQRRNRPQWVPRGNQSTGVIEDVLPDISKASIVEILRPPSSYEYFVVRPRASVSATTCPAESNTVVVLAPFGCTAFTCRSGRRIQSSIYCRGHLQMKEGCRRRRKNWS